MKNKIKTTIEAIASFLLLLVGGVIISASGLAAITLIVCLINKL